ncbi:hypothetical protein TNCT_312911 [Trichonephila clavata]|uniref:Zinc knuckle domain-containing protein n=1 Tax=Trichonephila clavata TaxID=2740835 RepID=A0A8X6M0Y9_TRICU|nr:hypothetical protein TNCT_312911 [Trichonephila clavata]
MKNKVCILFERGKSPTCINCNTVGHLANKHECPRFPKIKPKKGDTSQNRNNSSATKNVFNSSNLVRNNVSYANVSKTSQQREPLDGSRSAISETEAPKIHTEKPALSQSTP